MSIWDDDDGPDGSQFIDDFGTDTEQAPELEAGKFSSVPMGRKLAREALAGDVIYVTNLGWHKWDGTRWQPVPDDTIMALAVDWVEEELIALIRSGAEVDGKVVKAMLRYREVGNMRQLLAGARTEPDIIVAAAELDSHEGLLNCANGVLALTTGELGPHDPALLLTKTTGIKYLPDAAHDDWDKALEALPDDETATWLQTYLGAAATGERDRGGPILFQQGDGANGKTTVQGGVMHAFGEYAVQVPDKLLAGHGNEHDTLWMTLQGARLACIEELPEGHQLPVARIKKLADTPSITGRHIGRDYVTFPATHSLMVNTNYRPRVTETDHGTWRRLTMVEYAKTFDGASKDATLKRRLRQVAQAQAVLAWIVEGARLWYANGRTTAEPSAPMAAATDDWRSESDPLAVFLDERVQFTGNDDDRIPTTDLLESFNAWLPYGTRPWSSSLFGSRLRSHPRVKDAGARVDRGLRNRKPTGLTRAVRAGSAHPAQGGVGGSHENYSVQKLYNPPARPAHPHKSEPSATSATPATSATSATSDPLTIPVSDGGITCLCGAPIHRDRVAYGYDLCRDCERTPA